MNDENSFDWVDIIESVDDGGWYWQRHSDDGVSKAFPKLTAARNDAKSHGYLIAKIIPEVE